MFEAVNDLLKLNLVEEIFCAPGIIYPLSVSTRSSGKQRLILDLRHVNAFIYKQKFKCEDLSVATQIFDKGYYLFKFDPKSGYHHIEIFPEHCQYLAFAWDFGSGKFRYFQFCVLPFGLSSAPFIYSLHLCLFIPAIFPVSCLFAIISAIGFSQYFSPIFVSSRYLPIRFLGL